MDDIDEAQAREEADRQRALARRPVVAGRVRRIGGDCLECEAPIGAARLAAMPDAELCIECQRRLEKVRAQ